MRVLLKKLRKLQRFKLVKLLGNGNHKPFQPKIYSLTEKGKILAEAFQKVVGNKD